MELQKTPLTYQQASEVLGVSLETIKKAVLRGVLTRLPREGLYQHLMAGQVELFKGKTLSLSVLSENDRKLWQAYADFVNQPTRQDHSHVQERVKGITMRFSLHDEPVTIEAPDVESATAILQVIFNGKSSLKVESGLTIEVKAPEERDAPETKKGEE